MSSVEEKKENDWERLIQSLIDELYDIPLVPFNGINGLPATLSRGLTMCSTDELKGGYIDRPDDEIDPMDIDPEYQRVELEDLSTVHVQRYVGTEWEDRFIKPLENVAHAETPKEFAIKPHPWQLKGAAQMHWLCQSNFRGGICADAPGLGKTILAILAIHLAREEPGGCSLVVCPASCRLQWRRAIVNTYKKGSEPRILVLDDSKIPASELLRQYESNDIIIVSYNFITQNLTSIQQYQKEFRSFKDSNGIGRPPARPVAALTSEVWRMVGRPFKRVVFDECHMFKKKDGATYKAIKSLLWEGVIMLSGTPLSNDWTDVANPVTLLEGHSLTSWEKFVKAFSFHPPRNKRAESDIISIQRFLLAVMISRPSSCLNLPDLKIMSANFKLNEAEKAIVSDHTARFQRAMWAIENKKRTRSGPVDIKSALGLAVKAQLHAAHKILSQIPIPQPSTATAVGLEDETAEIVVQVIDELEDGLQNNQEDTWLEKLDQFTTEQLLDSSRVKAILKVISYALRNWPKEKIVIFSTFLKFLDIISRAVNEYLGIKYLRFDGTMNKDQKSQIEEEFKEDDNNLLLITAGAGTLGLNLQCASIIIQSEIWWNANNERQAYARCYRQGQEKTVKVFRLLATNSEIDKYIGVTQQGKKKTNDQIMQGLVKEHDAELIVPTRS